LLEERITKRQFFDNRELDIYGESDKDKF